jgi:hypothetical protein
MGLNKMQQLSDADGSTVRGKGPYDGRFFSTAPLGGTRGPSFSAQFSSHFTNFPGAGGGVTPPTTPPGPSTPPTPPAPTMPGLGSIPGLGNIFGSLGL